MPSEFSEPYDGWNDLEQQDLEDQSERDYQESEYEPDLPYFCPHGCQRMDFYGGGEYRCPTCGFKYRMGS